MKSVRTKTCHTFSLAPSKLQKRMLTPSRPCPPHMLLGVTDVSLSSSVLLLYTSIFTGFSTFAFNRSLRVSLSLFCECSNKVLVFNTASIQFYSTTSVYQRPQNTVYYQNMYLQLFCNKLPFTILQDNSGENLGNYNNRSCFPNLKGHALQLFRGFRKSSHTGGRAYPQLFSSATMVCCLNTALLENLICNSCPADSFDNSSFNQPPSSHTSSSTNRPGRGH